MRKILAFLLSALFFLVSQSGFAQGGAGGHVSFPFYVYKDGASKENHYIPSGFTGDYSAIKMDEKCKTDPKAGDSCIKFTYTGEAPQNLKWAGVFFQNPANNWGTIDGGYDLTGAKRLSFFARGEKGGEVVEFKMGGVNAAFSDSASATTGQVVLTKEWKEYQIQLQNEDLSYILTGFASLAEQKDAPDGQTFYLDEIAFVNDAAPQ